MFAPWKKSYDQPRQHIKKQRHYFANKCLSSQSYGFSSSHYGCDSWTVKKAEWWRIVAFELWCWRRLLRVPWAARRSKQSILKGISPEYSLEGLTLKLKLQYFGHLTHSKRPCCWKRFKVGGEGDNRGWDGWMASPTRWIRVWVSSGSWWRAAVHGVAKSQTRQSNWTEMNWKQSCVTSRDSAQDPSCYFKKWETSVSKFYILTTAIGFKSKMTSYHVTQMLGAFFCFLRCFKLLFHIFSKAQCPTPNFWTFLGDCHPHCCF